MSFDFGGSPHGSVDMNADLDANANVTVRGRRGKKSIEKEKAGEEKSKAKAKTKARRRESFGGVRGFNADTASPFSLNDGPMTPLSNGACWYVE